MAYDIPFSKLSRDTQALLATMGESYEIRWKEISDNCKALMDGLSGIKQDAIPEAPNDGQMYARINGQWAVVTAGGTVLDAPSDGQAYMRMNAAWTPLTDQPRTPDYDSGVLGSLAPGQTIITHNLNTPFEQLEVHVLFQRVDDSWFDYGSEADILSGANNDQSCGFMCGPYINNPSNALNIEVGQFGISMLGGTGEGFQYETWAYPAKAYRVVIYKKNQRVVVTPAGMEEDVHYYVDPLNHLYDHIIGRYYTIDGTWKPIYKATVNIPLFNMTPGVQQDILCVPDNIVDRLVGFSGVVVNQATPTAQIVIPTGFGSSDITSTRSLTVYKFSTGSIVLRDYVPPGWGILTYNGEMTVKFTALKDSWQA
jgi:hypothetical protein